MNRVYGFIPRDLIANDGKPVIRRGSEPVYQVSVPPVGYVDSSIGDQVPPVSEWSRIEIPAGSFEMNPEKFPPVDGKPVDYEALRNAVGDVCMASHYASGSLSVVHSDGGVSLMSTQDAFARLNAYMESEYIEKFDVADGIKRRDIYSSCIYDYPDEDPCVRIARMSRMEEAPTLAPDTYRFMRVTGQANAGLPGRTGFTDVSHALVPKDLISDDIITVEGVPCRKLQVPSNLNLGMYDIGDKFQYDTVCVRADYLWDAADLVGNPLGTDADKYLVCSLPYNCELYDTNGLLMRNIRPWEVSAKLTCAVSGRVLDENAPFGRSDYNEIFNRVMNASPTGPAWNLFEIKSGIPATALVIDYGSGFCRISDPETGKMDSDALFDMRAKFGMDEARDKFTSGVKDGIAALNQARDKFMAGVKDGIAAFNQAAASWYDKGVYMDAAMTHAFGMDKQGSDPFDLSASAPVNTPDVKANPTEPVVKFEIPNPFDVSAAPDLKQDTSASAGRDMSDINRAFDDVFGEGPFGSCVEPDAFDVP